ncbi:MAG: 4-(cytidine 5'-diphospho)-2-C-methyl-D-erythritol kinase [Clostridiales Family XIII bacterium]|jgi:4-diphosphocytidyl-2-C-methyl-D-erythritol kinase|nr:4-(cytidine 5'-diphospho)-2-C-methyl-D-erythritol kinase [Clostridiales Family XIII bacterium]
MRIKAPAKINLLLDVLGKRPDGYHEIFSVMQALELCDIVSAELADEKPGQKGTVHLSCRGRTDEPSPFVLDVPADESNLGYIAARAAFERFAPAASGGVRIDIEKYIPIAAGLAGGSADAAAVLLALARLWYEKGLIRRLVPLSEIAKAGTRIGADVAFCVLACAAVNPWAGYADDPLAAPAALAEGIGERVSGLRPGRKAHVLLVKPNLSVPTKEIYGLFDAGQSGAVQGQKGTVHLSCRGRTDEPSPFVPFCEMRNSLEPVTSRAYPAVAGLLAEMRAFCVGGKVLMSGSGPTVFAYFFEEKAAAAAYEKAQSAFPDMYVFLTRTA